MSNLREFVDNLLKIEYCAGKDYEDKIENLLRRLNFSYMTMEEFIQNEHAEIKDLSAIEYKKAIVKYRRSYKLCEKVPKYVQSFSGKSIYIREPFSTHANPDFIIIHNNSIIYLEAKTCRKQGSPQLNSAKPRENQLYIIKKQNEDTLLLLGQHIYHDKIRNICNEYSQKFKELTQKFNEKLKNLDDDDNLFGFSIYARGKNDMKFTMKHKSKCLNDVYNYIKGLTTGQLTIDINTKAMVDIDNNHHLNSLSDNTKSS